MIASTYPWVTISQTVDIEAEPERVFQIIGDPSRNALFNTNVQVITARKETDCSVGVGSVFYFKLKHGYQLVEYQTTCIQFIPNMLIETVSDTDPPFTVNASIKKTLYGCKLSQNESFRFTPDILKSLEWWYYPMAMLREVKLLVSVVPSRRHVERQKIILAELEHRLNGALMAWLFNIKRYVEEEIT